MALEEKSLATPGIWVKQNKIVRTRAASIMHKKSCKFELF